jgi:hypothetical protein
MRRRTFIQGIVGSAAAWPLAAQAQQLALPVIGVLVSRGAGDDPHLLAAFRQGLNDVGYVEGKNTAIEYRFAEGLYDRLPALAADLVRRPSNKGGADYQPQKCEGTRPHLSACTARPGR